MLKVCIICPYDYPIPTVQGGAVEQVTESFCIENEKNTEFELTVLTTYNQDAEVVGHKFNHTRFVYFKKSIFDNLFYFNYRLFRKIFHIYLPSKPRMIAVRKWLVSHEKEYDAILFEDGLTPMAHYLLRGIDRNKVFSHMHWPGLPDKNTQKFIGHLLPVSNYVGDEFITHCGKFPKITIDILKNGVDQSKFRRLITQEEKSALKKKLALSSDYFTILYVGRIIPGKGVRELIEAINLITDKKLALLIIGASSFGLNSMTAYEKEVAELIKKSPHKICMLGFVPNDELYKYQNISDCAILPSIQSEAAGLVNIEHMSAGLPLITTNIGGIPEYAVGNGVVKLNIDKNFKKNLANEICYIYEHKNLQKQMSESNLFESKEFTTEKIFENLASIINKYILGDLA